MIPQIFDLDAWAAAKAKRLAVAQSSGGIGGEPPGEVLHRVAALEKLYEKIDSKLEKLINSANAAALQSERRFGAFETRLTAIDGKLDAKASAADVAQLKGRLADLPSKWFVGTTAFAILFGAAALISAVLVYLERLRTLLGTHG